MFYERNKPSKRLAYVMPVSVLRVQHIALINARKRPFGASMPCVLATEGGWLPPGVPVHLVSFHECT